VQEEVGKRLAAGPGQMSLLSVAARLYGTAAIAARVKAGAFWPRPGVDSAVVVLQAHPRPILNPEKEDAFFALVRAGFGRKRKQLLGNLSQLGLSREELIAALAQGGVAPSRRAETLSLEEWLALYRVLSGDVPPAAGA
jgi:16S rRNA (adenine1518-N6/adenine1519-N6)-dimethyltransferase